MKFMGKSNYLFISVFTILHFVSLSFLFVLSKLKRDVNISWWALQNARMIIGDIIS